jgi:hypothetical protein
MIWPSFLEPGRQEFEQCDWLKRLKMRINVDLDSSRKTVVRIFFCLVQTERLFFLEIPPIVFQVNVNRELNWSLLCAVNKQNSAHPKLRELYFSTASFPQERFSFLLFSLCYSDVQLCVYLLVDMYVSSTKSMGSHQGGSTDPNRNFYRKWKIKKSSVVDFYVCRNYARGHHCYLFHVTFWMTKSR